MKRKPALILSFILVSAVVAVLSGCKQGAPAVTVKVPEATLSPMIVGSASVFMDIVNNGSGDDMLKAAHAEIAGAITELHDVQEGKMIKVKGIRISAQGTTALKPGTFHIMIFNMPRDTKKGYRFTLALTFEKSGLIKMPVTLSSTSSHSSESSMDHTAHGH
jgi:copper(I)-binding protein